MECGEEIRVKDQYGSYDCRFVAQCGGHFLLISRSGDYRNGFLLPEWHGVLRELVALAVPAKLTERTMIAESTTGGRYAYLPLTYPLSIKGLADLLGAPADEVRAQLADLAVEVDN